MSPGITVKPAVKTIAKQAECKSSEIWRARFLDMMPLSRLGSNGYLLQNYEVNMFAYLYPLA